MPAFFSAANALNIIKQSSYLIVLATAQMFVLLTRGFDLSLGVVVSMVSVASALIMAGIAPNGEGPVIVALVAGVLAGIAIGALAGAVNGVCVAYFGINPFVVTMGAILCLGFVFLLTNNIGQHQYTGIVKYRSDRLLNTEPGMDFVHNLQG